MAQSLTGRILIVEDEAVNQRILEQILAGAGLTSLTAGDGESALELASQGDIDLVLLDVVLPGIDGYEVIRRLRGEPSTREVPVVFISSLDEVADKVRGLELGAADYVAKPFNRHEVLARVRAQLRIRQLTSSLARANAELIEKQETLAEDLRAAADIQKALLPPSTIERETATIVSLFQPSIEVGGDIYNVVHVTDDLWIVFIADVSGHGVASALMTVSVTQRLSGPDGLARGATMSPSAILQQLDLEYPFERYGKYFSAALAVVDTREGTIAYTSAGHPSPFIARADGAIELLEAGGPIIGMGFGLAFEDGSARLRPGDRLVLYTDGVTDDASGEDEPFGVAALHAHFEARRRDDVRSVCESLFTRLDFRRGGLSPQDDLALIVVERKKAECEV